MPEQRGCVESTERGLAFIAEPEEFLKEIEDVKNMGQLIIYVFQLPYPLALGQLASSLSFPNFLLLPISKTLLLVRAAPAKFYAFLSGVGRRRCEIRPMRFLGRPSGDQRRQLATVDLLSSVFRPDAFEVDHRRFDVSMSQPACTVRMSTPSRRWLVAKVCRNL